MDNRVLIIKDYVKYYADEINKNYPNILSSKEIDKLSDKYSSMPGDIEYVSFEFSREMFERINIYSTNNEIKNTNMVMENKKNDEINIKSFSETYRENMTNLFKIYHDIVNNPNLDEAGRKSKFEEEERKYFLENHRYTISKIEKQITERYMMDSNSIERQRLLNEKVQPIDYDMVKMLYGHYVRDFDYIDKNMKLNKIDLMEKTTSKTSDRIGLETLKELLEYKKNNKDANLNIHYYALIWKNTISDKIIQEIKNVDLSQGSEEEKFNKKKDIAVKSISAFIKEFYEWSSKNGYVVNPEEIYKEIYNSNDTGEIITIHVPSGDINLKDGNENSKILHDLFVAPKKEVHKENKLEDKKEEVIDKKSNKSEEQAQKDNTLKENELDDKATREDVLNGNINIENSNLKNDKLTNNINVTNNISNLGGFALGAAGVASLLNETREENAFIKQNNDNELTNTVDEVVENKPEDYANELLNINMLYEQNTVRKSEENNNIVQFSSVPTAVERTNIIQFPVEYNKPVKDENNKVLKEFTPEEEKLASNMREENIRLIENSKPKVRKMNGKEIKYKNAGVANALIIAFLVGMIAGISLILFASLMGNI